MRLMTDFMCSEQHGFKKHFSTSTTMLQIQAKITDILESGKQVALISLDLSAVFDAVNHKLLLKRLKEVRISTDVQELLKSWLFKMKPHTSMKSTRRQYKVLFSAQYCLLFMSKNY